MSRYRPNKRSMAGRPGLPGQATARRVVTQLDSWKRPRLVQPGVHGVASPAMDTHSWFAHVPLAPGQDVGFTFSAFHLLEKSLFFFFSIFTREGLCFSYECRFLNRGVFSWSPPSVAGWSGRSRSRRCQPSPGKTACVRCLTPPVRELVVNGGRLTFWGRSILCSKI